MLSRIFTCHSSAYNVPLDFSLLFSASTRFNRGCDAFKRTSKDSSISPRTHVIPSPSHHKPQPPPHHPAVIKLPSSKLANFKGRPTIQEIYVDASNTGIGVVLGTKWLAWTFNGSPLIPRNITNKQIDTSWAELLAVELGVRTLVAGGARGAAVCVHSDNTSVVDALGRRRLWAKNVALNDVINRIGALEDAHMLDIEVKRVPGCENPADGPSKGRYPPFERLLGNVPDLPVHLQKVVSLVTK